MSITTLHRVILASAVLPCSILAYSPLHAQDAMLKEVINPPELPDSVKNGYSQVAVAPATSRLIYIAGQVGHSESGPNDFESQVDRAFDNMLVALSSAGGRPENVVKITLLIADHDPDKLAYVGKKRREVFGSSPPASLLIPVGRLYQDGVMFEIDAIAVAQPIE